MLRAEGIKNPKVNTDFIIKIPEEERDRTRLYLP